MPENYLIDDKLKRIKLIREQLKNLITKLFLQVYDVRGDVKRQLSDQESQERQQKFFRMSYEDTFKLIEMQDILTWAQGFQKSGECIFGYLKKYNFLHLEEF